MQAAKSLELIARDRSTLARVMERIPTYVSDFREDPKWLLMFVLGRTSLGRALYAHGGRRAPVPETSFSSMFDAPTTAVLSALDSDGVFDDLHLPHEVTAQVLDFALATGCFGNHDRNLDLTPDAIAARQSSDNPITSGHYFERVEQCDAVMRIQQDGLLHAVAADYLGPKAKIISTRLWWSFPTEAASSTEAAPEPREMLHFDLDDWRMLKFFFYITPVDDASGPHLYLRGSHKRHVLKHQMSLTVGRPMDEVVATYPEGRLARIFGPAGSGFAEDPYGYHAGALARAGRRLMLEIGFGITPPNRRRFFGERIVK